MNALEARLASAFNVEAASTPLPNPEWPGPAYPVAGAGRLASRHRRSAVFAVAAAVTVAALVGITLSRSERSGTSTAAAPWKLGAEFATVVSERTSDVHHLAKPGSVVFIDVPNEPTPRASFETATYEPTGVIR
jgi:hypothetical protein